MDLKEKAKAYYRAFEQHDRSFMEANLRSDFTFTSPFDDHIDRAAWFDARSRLATAVRSWWRSRGAARPWPPRSTARSRAWKTP